MAVGFRRPPGGVARRSVAVLAAVLVATTTAGPLAGAASAGDATTLRSDMASLSLLAPDATVGAAPVSAVEPPPGASPAAGLEPSIQYEQAEAHANDSIAFTVGSRVTVGFSPRGGDRWSVGGTAPTKLPAGRLDGRTIRRQAEAPAPAPAPRPAVRHAPSVTHGMPSSAVDQPNSSGPTRRAMTASFAVGLQPASPGGTVTTDAAVVRTGLRKEVFGFLPYWELPSKALHLDFNRISTIAYFGVGADAAGNLQKRNPDGSVGVGWAGWTSSRLTSVISAAHRSHTRVVLTVQSFGWNTNGLARQRAVLGSAAARANLARQIAAAIRDRGADGVNLDFEPLARGVESQFVALVRTIRADLDRIHKGYQITFDTTGSIGNYPIEAATAAGGADAIFVMGYDYRTSGSSPVGSIAPVTRGGYDIVDTINAYTARVSASKVILGVPWYGRGWSTSSGALDATNTSSSRTGASTAVDYDTAIDYLKHYGRHYDAVEQVAWTAYRRQSCTSTGCVTSWRQLYVDDATAMSRKLDLVNQAGLRGVGIWALGYDGSHPELWNAIQHKLIDDTTPPTVGIRALPGVVRNPSFGVAWTGTDDVAIKSYDVQASVDGGRWTNWLTATTKTEATWLGDDTHRYAFRVRARDPKGNVSAWNVTSVAAATPPATLAVGGFGLVRTDGLPVRASADTSGVRVGTLAAGDRVRITGGPRMADGYTWFQVQGPLTTWGPIAPRLTGRWVAISGGGRTNMVPVAAPNTTTVAAMIGGLRLGTPGNVGASPAATAARAFSPNGDRSRDGLVVQFTNGTALRSLILRVWRTNGSIVGDVPVNQLAAGSRAVTWNGAVSGHRLPDGRYLVSLIGRAGSTTWFNPVASFRPSALATYGVAIDTVPPRIVSASASGSLLSPNGDRVLDSLHFDLVASGATSWALGIAPVAGSTLGAPVLVRSGSGGRVAATWDGRTGTGSIAADGLYRVQALVADAAGSRASRTWTVRLDRTPPAITLSTPGRFSPNRDGDADTARLAWTAGEAASGSAAVYHGSTLIRAWPVSRSPVGAVTWNGTSRSGAAVPDGTYTFRVTLRDAAGNTSSRSVGIVVDRTLSTARWSTVAFAPQDGDALAATDTIGFLLARPARVSLTLFGGGKPIRTVWTNRSFGAGSHSWVWDGRMAGGAMAAGGTYVAQLTVTGAMGTTVVTRPVDADEFRTALSATTLRAGQTLTITIVPVEPLRAAPNVTFAQPGRPAVRRAATSIGGGAYRVVFAVARGTRGTATITLAGRDVRDGLNVSTRTVSIR